MVIEILLCLAILYSIFISYTVIAALRRINQYEGFILKLQQIIEYGTEKMKSVDASGHYESDDGTSFFFEQLKELQLILNDLFEIEKDKK